MRSILSTALCSAAYLLAATSTVPSARADPIAEFYKGRNVSWMLSTGEGGGYASYARAFAPFFGSHIPGKPNIVIQNMPGGGGIRAMNFLHTLAPKDGSTLGLVHSSVPFAPLFGISGASFDPRQMQWIGSINRSTAICVAWGASGVRTWQDLFTKEYLVGGTGAGSQMETMPTMLNQLFGTRIKVISGYRGGNDVYLAMERGEVHGRCGGLVSSINSTRPEWFGQNKINVPVQVAMQRSPLFPDVPAVAEHAKDERTRQILRLVLAPLDMDRPILAPPGTPADRVAALRVAFHAAMKDPGFLAEAEKHKLEVGEVDGATIARIIAEAFALPADVVKAASTAMSLTGTQSAK